MTRTLLIHNGPVLSRQDGVGVFDRGYVHVVDRRIAMVGAGAAPPELLAGAEQVIDAAGMVTLPGLVNAHTHLFQTFMRGLADDKPLLHWLEAAIWPGALAMTEDDIYLAALLGLVECLHGGATSVLSQHYVQTSPRNMDRVAEAVERCGVRAVLARGFADRDPYHPAFQEPPEQVIAETERLMRQWNTIPDGRLRVQFGPLIPWGCRPQTLQQIHRLAHEWGVSVHIHLGETQAEVQMTVDETGVRPVRWLHQLGVLDERWQLVHGVWLDDDELDLIAASGTTLIHCPISNMYLASGIPRVAEWRKRHIPVALATDGPGSNNSQDMLEVLKFTACLAKLADLDATALLPDDVLDMACAGGARAMGLAGEVGVLRPGALADIILVRLQRSHISPVHSVSSALVYNANRGDVDTVIVDGAMLMRNGTMLHLDEQALIAECQAAAERLIRRAGITVGP